MELALDPSSKTAWEEELKAWECNKEGKNPYLLEKSGTLWSLLVHRFLLTRCVPDFLTEEQVTHELLQAELEESREGRNRLHTVSATSYINMMFKVQDSQYVACDVS